MQTRFISVIAGLGNYVAVKSRHSIGMQICNAIADTYNCNWNYERKYKAYTALVVFENHEFILVKSKWPMNLNGRSLVKIVKELDIDVNRVTVIHDDLDRKLGKFSWKLQGSAGGHNGVKSVISSLKSNNFRRLRVGIGRPQNCNDIVGYVLENFELDEQKQVDDFIQKCAQVIIDDVFPKPKDEEKKT